MAHELACNSCGRNLGQVAGTQKRGFRLKDFSCACGGDLRRVGWQEQYRAAGRLKSAADVAAELLRETGGTSIGRGDTDLLHQVALLLGMKTDGLNTENRVLGRIERSFKDVLEKRAEGPGRGVSRYWLP